MNTISFPRYSFVQAEPDPLREDVPASCHPDPRACLPMSTPVNLAFQVVAGDDITFPSYPTYRSRFYAYAVPADDPIRWETQTSGTFAAHTAFIRASNVDWTMSPGYILARFDDASGNDSFQSYPVAPGVCFKLQFVYEVYYNTGGAIHERRYLGCSNCFVRIAVNQCYTTLLQYRNDTNAFDYLCYYQDTNGVNTAASYYNKAELPMYLKNPVMNDDTKVYTRSDGSIIKLYERKEEQYLLETDLMPYTWLRALDVALSHDTILLSNANLATFDPRDTPMFFHKKENMEIEYPKGPFSAYGKASCKLLNAQPVHLYNNNCG